MCDLEAKNIPCSYHPVLEAGAVIWLLPRSTSFGRLLTSSSFADKSTLFGQGCVFSELLVNGYMSGLFGLEAFYIYINRLRELMCRRQFRSEISSRQFGSGPFTWSQLIRSWEGVAVSDRWLPCCVTLGELEVAAWGRHLACCASASPRQPLARRGEPLNKVIAWSPTVLSIFPLDYLSLGFSLECLFSFPSSQTLIWVLIFVYENPFWLWAGIVFFHPRQLND